MVALALKGVGYYLVAQNKFSSILEGSDESSDELIYKLGLLGKKSCVSLEIVNLVLSTPSENISRLVVMNEFNVKINYEFE